jgi:hypothetical protein
MVVGAHSPGSKSFLVCVQCAVDDFLWACSGQMHKCSGSMQRADEPQRVWTLNLFMDSSSVSGTLVCSVFHGWDQIFMHKARNAVMILLLSSSLRSESCLFMFVQCSNDIVLVLVLYLHARTSLVGQAFFCQICSTTQTLLSVSLLPFNVTLECCVCYLHKISELTIFYQFIVLIQVFHISRWYQLIFLCTPTGNRCRLTKQFKHLFYLPINSQLFLLQAVQRDYSL